MALPAIFLVPTQNLFLVPTPHFSRSNALRWNVCRDAQRPVSDIRIEDADKGMPMIPSYGNMMQSTPMYNPTQSPGTRRTARNRLLLIEHRVYEREKCKE